MTKHEEITAEILWFESLQDSIRDGETEDALKAIDAAIKLKRRERASLIDDNNPAA